MPTPWEADPDSVGSLSVGVLPDPVAAAPVAVAPVPVVPASMSSLSRRCSEKDQLVQKNYNAGVDGLAKHHCARTTAPATRSVK